MQTFLIKYGMRLKEGDEKKLAKFDMLDLRAWYYDHLKFNGKPNTWNAIKKINPHIQIYLYVMGPETASFQDNTRTISRNSIARCNDALGHSMGALNKNNPDLFLLDAKRKRVCNHAYSKPGKFMYLMDVGRSKYSNYWLQAVRKDIIQQAWKADGIFADNCAPLLSNSYKPWPEKYSTNARWTSAMNKFTNRITAGLQARSQKVWCNIGNTGLPEGYKYWQKLDATKPHPDVLLEEGAFVAPWGLRRSQHARFFPEAHWKRQVDTLRTIKRSRVAFHSHIKLDRFKHGIDTDGNKFWYEDALWYAMSSFLLGQEKNSYFNFKGKEGFRSITWYDEYDHPNLNLGRALGKYTSFESNGINVYKREFEKGAVYVNPNNKVTGLISSRGRKLHVTNFKRRLGSIPRTNRFRLNAHRGTIILK